MQYKLLKGYLKNMTYRYWCYTFMLQTPSLRHLAIISLILTSSNKSSKSCSSSLVSSHVSRVSRKGQSLGTNLLLVMKLPKNSILLRCSKLEEKGWGVEMLWNPKKLFWHLGVKTTNNINYPKNNHGLCHGTSVSFGLPKVPLRGKFKQNCEW